MVLTRVACRLVLPLLCLLGEPLHASSWIASVDQRSGLPILSMGGATAVSGDFVFWKKDWAWSGLSAEFKVLAPGRYVIAGRNQGLDFDLNARIAKASDRQLVWTFDLDAHS